MTFLQLIRTAFVHNASDLHLSDGYPPAIRVDGDIRTLSDEPLTAAECETLAGEILNARQKAVLDELGEVDFAWSVPDVSRLRINVYRQSGTTAIAARLLNERIPTPKELRLPDALVQMTDKKRGLILVTGITGSGKSTTLASLIQCMNEKYNYHIITIEEPIEYIYPRGRSVINQREMGSDSMTFANALRAALRQDPDVILVGEMRDLETISTAITAAETGHLVLSTLHTIGAASTIDRIVDVFPPYQQDQIRTQLADVLECVVSQQLIPLQAGKGRIVATELMLNTNAIRNHIREGKTYQIPNAMQTSRRSGMMMMDDSILDLYVRGEISGESAMIYAQDREAMSKKIY